MTAASPVIGVRTLALWWVSETARQRVAYAVALPDGRVWSKWQTPGSAAEGVIWRCLDDFLTATAWTAPEGMRAEVEWLTG